MLQNFLDDTSGYKTWGMPYSQTDINGYLLITYQAQVSWYVFENDRWKVVVIHQAGLYRIDLTKHFLWK